MTFFVKPFATFCRVFVKVFRANVCVNSHKTWQFSKAFLYHLVQDLQSRIPKDDLKLPQSFFQKRYSDGKCKNVGWFSRKQDFLKY